MRAGPVPEIKVRGYLTQLLQALAYLHSLRYYHGHVRLENILLVGGKAKLSDFSRADRFQDGSEGGPAQVAEFLLWIFVIFVLSLLFKCLESSSMHTEYYTTLNEIFNFHVSNTAPLTARGHDCLAEVRAAAAFGLGEGEPAGAE